MSSSKMNSISNSSSGSSSSNKLAAGAAEAATVAQLSLPAGFRFHPTDEELVVHYLVRKAAGRGFALPIIAEVDLYKFDPWELPDKAILLSSGGSGSSDKEWYFFSPRDRKYPNGARPNRAAGSGYWKATGTDKAIAHTGVKKALVFYKGRAPKGVKTNWIMHEYRLNSSSSNGSKRQQQLRKGSLRLDDWVLCRIYKKSGTGPKTATAAAAPPKLEAEDESCLEEVLASLPDIDDSKICFPTLGLGASSFTAMLNNNNNNNNSNNQGCCDSGMTTIDDNNSSGGMTAAAKAAMLPPPAQLPPQQTQQQQQNFFTNLHPLLNPYTPYAMQQQHQTRSRALLMDEEVESRFIRTSPASSSSCYYPPRYYHLQQ